MRSDKEKGSPRRLLAGAAVTAALLVPLAVWGGPAIAQSASAVGHEYGSSCTQYGSSGGQYGSSGGQYGSAGGQYGSSCTQYRVRICHRTHSKKHPWVQLTISSRAVRAHLRHGDTMPPCTVILRDHHGKPEGKAKPHHEGGNDHGDSHGAVNGNTSTGGGSGSGHGHENGGGHGKGHH